MCVHSDPEGLYTMSEHKKDILLTLPDLVEGKVEKRPSKTCKSPYVTDILYEGKEYMGHTCTGLLWSVRQGGYRNDVSSAY